MVYEANAKMEDLTGLPLAVGSLLLGRGKIAGKGVLAPESGVPLGEFLDSARRFGIKGRGTLEVGNWADITVFDYKEIRDNTTLSNTGASPSGIRHVFIF